VVQGSGERRDDFNAEHAEHAEDLLKKLCGLSDLRVEIRLSVLRLLCGLILGHDAAA